MTKSNSKIVADGLNKTANKLLELNLKNKLLNFKHGNTGLLRFVDNTPNFIYDYLLDSSDDIKKGLLISHVPLPKNDNHVDSDLPLLIQNKDDNFKQNLKKIDEKTHADNIGIHTDYNMIPSLSDVKNNKSDKLQTLLYPEKMDKIIRRIQSKAKTTIEESGVNMLFLCFGFLKWNDSNNSSIFNDAPLIMMPVEIERDKVDAKTGFAKFRLRYTGEDVLDNICLREKLRQFGFELPLFEDFSTPEEYFSELLKQISDIKPEWSIHRFVTLSFLSFGKMLMYLDLKNLQSNAINDLEHISDIFEGNHSSGNDVASEYDIDNDKNIQYISQIMDADSSQHSAIIDAVSGRNLVIEGPPGTGKSQTITNIISTLISQGKTVLFVSEKLAALQVVKKRLDNAGLGNFCLELHSHKTQKKAILNDLKQRLEMNTNEYRLVGEKIEEKLIELNSKKTQLIKYSQIMNIPFGHIELTPYEIFWKTEFFNKECSQDFLLDNLDSLEDTDKITRSTLQNNLDAIKNIADSLSDYFENKEPQKNHYWKGLNFEKELDYTEQQETFTAFSNLYKTAIQAKTAFEFLRKDNLDFNKLKYSEIKGIYESDFKYAHYFNLLNIPTLENDLNDSIDAISLYQKTLNTYLSVLKDKNISQKAIDNLDKTLIDNSNLPQLISIQEFEEKLIKITQSIELFIKTKHLFKEAYLCLNIDLEKIDDLGSLSVIEKVAKIVSQINNDVVSCLSDDIEKSIDNPLVTELIEKAELLKKQEKELAQTFHFNVLPQKTRLSELVSELNSKSIFRIFSTKMRLAKEEIKQFCNQHNNKNLINDLENLIHYLNDKKDFEDNKEYKNLLPKSFIGLETNIDNLKRAINFYKILRTEICSIPIYGDSLYQNLGNLNSDILNFFSTYYASFADALDALNTIKRTLLLFDIDIDKNNVESLIKIAQDFEKELSLLINQINASGLPKNICLKHIKEAIFTYSEFTAIKDEFNVNKIISLFEQDESLEHKKEIITHLKNTFEKIKNIFPFESIQHILNENGFKNLCKIIEAFEDIREYQKQLESLTVDLSVRKYIATICDIEHDILKKYNQNTHNFDENIVLKIIEKFCTLRENEESFFKWFGILNQYEILKNLKIDKIIKNFTSAAVKISYCDYVNLYQYLFYYSLSREVLRKLPILGSFSRITHENIRNSFREIDIDIQKLNAQKLIFDLSKKQIPEGEAGRSPKEFTNKRLIEHEISKKKAHIPIRKMIDRAFDALIAMKPCFMMSPLSVAQYIHSNHQKFDIIIIDEASQVKPEDAIGVLARAKQIVIVGDSNQLPPTSFFNTFDDDSDDEEETTIDNSESILDVCKPLYQPIRRLRWHYRSRHQSLISFSNKHFYDNDLIIFPSPVQRSDVVGVKHIFVDNGIYNNQCNPLEAQRIIEEIIDMIEQYPELTYGIVTLNAKQKMTIEDEIERVRKNNTLFDKYLCDASEKDDDFFVKNLENVQGDERDVIFISTTFGSNQEGIFKQNFGPIIKEDGWRRLNVLFTRAKQHVRIFSSFKPEQLKIDDTKEQRGLRTLKDYLNYAITGFDNHNYLTRQEPDSDFEHAVGSFLIQNGYDVVYQLGVAGYRIDIVIKDPKCPTNYIIAIECDGATYHSARTARDRDRLREENLRKLGWTHIHRIWSTDWFKKRKNEEHRLLTAIQSAQFEKILVDA